LLGLWYEKYTLAGSILEASSFDLIGVFRIFCILGGILMNLMRIKSQPSKQVFSFHVHSQLAAYSSEFSSSSSMAYRVFEGQSGYSFELQDTRRQVARSLSRLTKSFVPRVDEPGTLSDLRINASAKKSAQQGLKESNAALREAWNKDLLKRLVLRSAEDFGRQCLGSTSTNARQVAHRKLNEGSCIAVRRGTRVLFPEFQIDLDTLQLYPEIAQLIAHFPGLREKPERSMSLLRWMDQPHPALYGLTPFDRWNQGQRASVVQALVDELAPDVDGQPA